jgi:glycosyltransferase involved in cell wall biosynthesis
VEIGALAEAEVVAVDRAAAAGPKRLAVMFVIYGLAPAGPERRILELARAFPSCPESLDVHVCVVGDDLTLLNEFRRTGAKVVHLPIRRPWTEWRKMRDVLAYIERHEIRVLNSFNLKTLLVCAAAKLRYRSRVRLVHHLISLWDDISPANQRIIWTALRCADRVLCNGQAVKAHVIGARTLAQPVSVIPNGVDADHFRPMPRLRASERARLGLADEHFVVGTIGNIRPVKNIPFLLQAMTRVAAVAPRVRLVCVGGGPQLEEIKQLARSLGLAERVVFTGVVKDVRPMLAAMDAFALCSRQEGNPNVVLQAMAMALPVVSVSVGEVPFVVDDGRSGLLVAPGDEDAFIAAVTGLARDPQRCRTLGDAARRRVTERFSAATMIANYAALMKAAADNS